MNLNILKILTYCIFVLAPIQLFGVQILTTQIDWSSIFFLFWILFVLCLASFRTSSVLILIAVVFVNLILFFLGDFKISRFISSFAFFFSFLIAALAVPNVNFHLNPSAINEILRFSSLLSAFLIILEFLFFEKNRPHAFFQEPSGAGLFLYAYSISKIISIFYKLEKSTKLRFFELLFILSAAVITSSTHVFSAFVGLVFIVLYSGGLGLSRLPLIGFIFSVTLYYSLETEHIYSRINFADNLNLSQLAWLQGLDQATHVLSESPIFGLGFGSTGSFKLNSVYFELLDEAGIPGLNLLDAYSGLFRVIIETGLLGLFFIVFLTRHFLKMIKLYLLSPILYNDSIKLTAFSLVVFIGVLLKEPVWSRSFLPIIFVSIFILKTNYHFIKPLQNTGPKFYS